jgi:hypothetical protein
MKRALVVTTVVAGLLLAWYASRGTLASAPEGGLPAASPEIRGSAGVPDAEGRRRTSKLVLDEANGSRSGQRPVKDQVQPGAGVVLLDPRTGAAVAEVPCRFESASGSVLEAQSSAEASLPLAPGSWRVSSPGLQWSLTPENFVLRAGERIVLWASRPASCAVRVMSRQGAPVEGARVEWWPGRSAQDADLRPLAQRGPDRVAFTDVAGLAWLEPIGAGVGTLRATAQAYQPAERVLLRDARISTEEVLLLTPDDRPGRDLRFVTRSTGEPVSGLRITTRGGRHLARGDERGRVRLPAWLDPKGYVFLSAEGHVSAALKLSALVPSSLGSSGGSSGPEPIPWARAVRVRITGSSDAPFRVWTTLPDEPGGALVYLPDDGAGSDMALAAVRAWPLGSRVRIDAVDGAGRSAEATLEVTAAEDQVELDFEAGPYLTVYAFDSRGVAVTGLEAAATMSSGRRAVVLGAGTDGALRIPVDSNVDGFELKADGFGALSLEARGTGAEGLAGELTLTLERTADLNLLVNDTHGDPIGGLEVAVWDQSSRSAFELYPELHGSLPTDHPGWIVSSALRRTGTTDHRGRLRIPRLPLGQYEALADVPERLDPGRSSTYRPARVPLLHGGDAPRELSFPRPALVRIDVYSEPSGAPVDGVRLHSLERSETLFPGQPGAIWQGWIDRDLGELRVSSQGHSSAMVYSQDLADAGTTAVGLRTDQATILRFTGEWGSVPDGKLTLRARREWRAGEEVVGHREVWSETVTITPDGRVEVALPFEGEYETEPVQAGDGVWSFEPEKFYWTPGIEPELRVVLREGD